MSDTWTDTAGIIRDQIGVVVTDGPVYGALEALGVYEGDTALLVVEDDFYEANDGTLQASLPVFYPGTDTYEDSAGTLHETTLIGELP